MHTHNNSSFTAPFEGQSRLSQ